MRLHLGEPPARLPFGSATALTATDRIAAPTKEPISMARGRRFKACHEL
jgi:hypothetical protein